MQFLEDIRKKAEQYTADHTLSGIFDEGPDRASLALQLEELKDNTISFGSQGKVRYNSFKEIDFRGPEIPHQEWRARLNRYFWLEPLSIAYQETRDERWARLARDSIEAWMDFRHFTGTETVDDVWPAFGDNCLSVSIRLGQGAHKGWWGAVPYFDGSPLFDEAFIARMRASTAEQLEFMRRNITRNGNFRISQLETFLFLSLVLPGEEQYREFAVDGLNAVFRLQVGADGSHCEHTPGYHNWMCRLFTGLALLARRRPELGLEIPADRLLAMWNYTIETYAPDGRNWGLGDTESWYRGAESEDLPALKAKRDVLAEALNAPVLPAVTAFPDAGQYFMHAPETAFLLDATNFGGWHCHLGRGALSCWHKGTMFLTDPGSFTYELSDPFMLPSRYTPMHSTVTVNGLNQLAQADARVTDYRDTPESAFFRCCYAGGWSSAPFRRWTPIDADSVRSLAGKHVRTFFWRKDHWAICVDLIEALEPEAEFSAHWQFGPEETNFDGAHGRITLFAGGAGLAVSSPWSSTPVRSEVIRGDRERMLGFTATDPNTLSRCVPSPMLTVTGKIRGNEQAVLVTVLKPFEGREAPRITAEGSLNDGVLFLSLEIGDEKVELSADETYLAAEANFASVGANVPYATNAPFAVRSGDFSWEA